MSPKSPAEQLYGLYKLSGNKSADVPASSAARNVLMLRLINEALSRGVTWGEVGNVLVGARDGKLAKKTAKALARQVQRDLLRRDISDVI